MTSPNSDLARSLQELLPTLIAEDPQIRDFVLRTVSNYYASREETESRFDRILDRLDRESEENNRRWAEQHEANQQFLDRLNHESEENNRRWAEQHEANQQFLDRLNHESEENNRRWAENKHQWDENRLQWEESRLQWDENSRRWNEQNEVNKAVLAELKQLDRTYKSTIGALGSRWGLYSEASFREGLKAILEESFGVQVLNVNDFDDEGEVFGRPDQVELDLVIKNGVVIVCEIKSSVSKSEMYIFDRKVSFYQKRHQRPVTRKMVISPMVDKRAEPVAEALGIEVYGYADDVERL